jgi:hypothetical protein
LTVVRKLVLASRTRRKSFLCNVRVLHGCTMAGKSCCIIEVLVNLGCACESVKVHRIFGRSYALMDTCGDCVYHVDIGYPSVGHRAPDTIIARRSSAPNHRKASVPLHICHDLDLHQRSFFGKGSDLCERTSTKVHLILSRVTKTMLTAGLSTVKQSR